MMSPYVRPWIPPQMWRGNQCFVIGGGPSVSADAVAGLSNHHVIAVNGSYGATPWADVLFFSDTQWFTRHRSDVEAFRGLVVSTSYRASEISPSKVKYVSSERVLTFPPPGCGILRDGRSSGQRAISLAIAFGASRVVLVGFDMRVVDGRSHFHDEYRNDACRYRDLFIPAFHGWARDAARLGVSIVNATPGSALKEFPMTTLARELTRVAA
jgi:hypothetical protein